MDKNRSEYYQIQNILLLEQSYQDLQKYLDEVAQRANPTGTNEKQGEADQALNRLKKIQRRLLDKLDSLTKELVISERD